MRGTFLLGLGLGTLGVIVGLLISYFQKSERVNQPPVEVETAKVVAPAEMPGLGYLPEGTDSVVALQLRPLLQALPDSEGKDARAALLRLGIPPEVIAGFDRAVGVGLDNIDQAVIGLKLKEGSLINRVVMVVHTRESYSIEAVAEKLKAKPFTKEGRLFYHFLASPQLPIEVACWAPNDRVLVVGLDADQLKAIPAEGRRGLGHLPPRVAEIIGQQLAGEPSVWAVLDSEKWDGISSFVLIAGMKRLDLAQSIAEPMSRLRTAVIALSVQGEPALTTWFDLKSEASATELRDGLQTKFKDDDGKVTVGGAGNRVMVRTAVGNVRGAIRKVLPK